MDDSTETQQSGHAPRSGPEVKNGRSGAEDGAPERLGCGTVKEEMTITSWIAELLTLQIIGPERR